MVVVVEGMNHLPTFVLCMALGAGVTEVHIGRLAC